MTEIDGHNELFVHNYREYYSSDSLCTMFQTDVRKLVFILNTVVLGLASDRNMPDPVVYFPIIYNERISQHAIEIFLDILSNVDDFIKLFYDERNKFKYNKDADIIRYLDNLTIIGNKFAKLLYFTVFTNQISFKYVALNGSLDSQTDFFTVSHIVDKEKEFYNINSSETILFHGTSTKNVYSIMRNGIRSMSETKYMTNGNVFGNGIYLTDSILKALSYSEYAPILDRISVEKVTSCVLIFSCKNLNWKTEGIFVQKENEIILRSILWVKGANPYSYYVDEIISRVRSIKYKPPETIQNMKSANIGNAAVCKTNSDNINTGTKNNVQINSAKTPLGDKLSILEYRNEPGNSLKVVTKNRFLTEIKKLENEVGKSIILKMNFMIPTDNRTPLLILLSPTKDSNLEKDLIKYNIPGILVAFYFLEGNLVYPLAPPKVRVINPIFMRQTGRVTEGGSICADILYSDSWSPANTIMSIVNSISELMSNDGIIESGRVDPDSIGKSYTYEQYERSYSQVASNHGFLTIL